MVYKRRNASSRFRRGCQASSDIAGPAAGFKGIFPRRVVKALAGFGRSGGKAISLLGDLWIEPTAAAPEGST
jgi:hypothetical protein